MPKRPNTPLGGPVLLALDISSVCVGWAEYAGGRLVRHGRYHHIGADHGEKLLNFQHWLVQRLADLQPDQVVYEPPYPGRNKHAFGVLSLYCAVLLLTHFASFGREIPKTNRPRSKDVKRVMKLRRGRTHEENKKIAVLDVNRRHGLRLKYKPSSKDKKKKISQDDEADAITLGDAWHRIQAGSPEC